MSTLPIDALRPAFEAALDRGPVVVSAPTGSGKSTQVPRWLRRRGRVLVVEPRRVACRSLAQRVAHLEGCPLGHAVGYRVRDDDRARADTAVLFVTPGVALRMMAGGDIDAYATLVLDEFHERSLDTDLLLALFLERHRERLVVMSATLEGDRVAAHLGGEHLAGEGRLFPVDVRYRAGSSTLPSDQSLPQRVAAAVEASAADPGDVLVFLPGKAEIGACERALAGRRDLRVLPLHGGLTLDQQSAVFAEADRRKVILATNVAETSLTLPGIGVVIDSGLVRRTRYASGRGFLTLMSIARDSADQRSGRAGRLGPGICYRLWSERAPLDAHTPPEIHRESLVPLVMAAAACERTMASLAFLDAPKAHAVEAAAAELASLGALTEAGLTETRLTDTGRALFGLPLDPQLGRLLVEAKGTPSLPDMIDLVAVLAVGRPLWRPGPSPADPGDDLRDGGCDAVAFIRAIREGVPERHGLRGFTLGEARRVASRLRRAFGAQRGSGAIDRRALALTALRADRRLAHVARRRKRNTAWSNGGTEIELGRDTALLRHLDTPEGQGIEAALVFETRAIGIDERRKALLATCAMPVPLQWLVAGDVGRPRVGRARVERGVLVADVERVHARKVLSTRRTVPEGDLACAALTGLLLEGLLWRKAIDETRDRLERRALHAQLARKKGEAAPEVPTLEAWVTARVAGLGMESGRDLALLSPEDFVAEGLPEWEREALDRTYPRHLSFSDADIAVTYDLARRRVHLEQTGGRKDPPPLAWLPAFSGMAIEWRRRNVSKVLRARR